MKVRKCFNMMKKVNCLNVELFGVAFFSTMPIVGIPVLNRYISIFEICFLVFLLNLSIMVLAGRTEMRFSNRKIALTVFLIWNIISSCVGVLTLPSEWHGTIASYSIKSIQYIVLIVLVSLNQKNIDPEKFFKGLIWGCQANAIWAIAEGVSYNFFNFRLNDNVFAAYTSSLDRSTLIVTQYGIRASGFNYDPAHLGGILPILIAYAACRKKIVTLCIGVIALAFSQSSTALVGCVVCTSIICVWAIRKNVFQRACARKNLIQITKKLAIMLLSVILVLTLWSLFSATVSELISFARDNLEGFFDRFWNVYVKGGSTSLRGVYYSNFIYELINKGPFKALTGTGIGTSGYAYYRYPGVAVQGVFDVESVYISYAFGTGLIGLFLYIYVLASLAITELKSDLIEWTPMRCALLSVIVCGVFYHYTLTAYQILILVFSILAVENRKPIVDRLRDKEV